MLYYPAAKQIEKRRKSITKKELIVKLAERTGSTQKAAAELLGAFTVVCEEALVAGESVTLPGFLSLSVKDVPARSARNPRTGETVEIAAHKSVAVKVGKSLKDAVNK